jgi:hypothetical protein
MDMTDNHRFMEIDALTCRVTIRFGRDLRKLLILCPSRRCLRLPAGLFKFHCRFQVKSFIILRLHDFRHSSAGGKLPVTHRP